MNYPPDPKNLREGTKIVHAVGSTTLLADATYLAHYLMVKKGLELYNKSKMIIARNATPAQLCLMAGNITGKKYSNTTKGRTQAAADVGVKLEELRAAIQHEHAKPNLRVVKDES